MNIKIEVPRRRVTKTVKLKIGDGFILDGERLIVTETHWGGFTAEPPPDKKPVGRSR